MRVYQRKYKDRQGREKKGKTWWLLAYVGGQRIHQSLRTKDKRAAELMAGDLIRREELKRAGIVDPFGEQHERPLREHIADFEKTLRARGVVKKYLEDRMGCLRAYVEDIGAKHIKDLDLPGASGFLTQVKATGGLGAHREPLLPGHEAVRASGWYARGVCSSIRSTG